MARAFFTIIGGLALVAVLGAGAFLAVFWHFGRGLPDYQQLADYQPPVMTRVHAGDGRLLAEFAIENRVFVPMRAFPRRVINAVLAAEDKNFYDHIGVDPLSILRAVVVNVRNIGSSRRPVGASTITQQVAKNFLLSNEVSITRKAKEAILAVRIERAFSKDRILELYLNEIYLGRASYGFAAAALNYFNKPLDELSIAEAAFLAALPKAPSNYNPVTKLDAARDRRDWVIGRMLAEKMITPDEAAQARATALLTVNRAQTEFVKATYFSEEVRRELAGRYGENQLYKGGLSVHSTLDPKMQEVADRTLRKGLEAYDRRHGWRGPMARIEMGPGQLERLAKIEKPRGMGAWRLGLITALNDDDATIAFVDGLSGKIPMREMKWARKWLKGEYLGPSVKQPKDVLQMGDVVAVEAVHTYGPANGEKKSYPAGTYALRQIPEVQGALVALDPHTGRILAMSGGYDSDLSEFNRAVQAKRQPGSAFKPFVYLAALDSGYTPSTLILDAPFVIDQGPGLPKWRPANYTQKFYGPSTMRLGIEKSRNLMTVRLAQAVGMEKISNYAKRFGINVNLPEQLSMSLGSGETTLLDLTAAYGMLVNGGKQVLPSLIDRIQDRNGHTVFRHDTRPCDACSATAWSGQPVPEIPDMREQLTEATSAYQMVSMLEGVVERGTGRRARAVGKPLGGKTGTTNESVDAWFVGFSPDLAVGVFVGFDEPRSLGKNEQGASVAAPIFTDFMTEALDGKPATPFRVPPGIHLVRVNATTGLPAQVGEGQVILEAFKEGSVPSGPAQVLDGVSADNPTGQGVPSTGTGGLY